MKWTQEFNWRLKSLLPYSFPVIKRRIKNPQEILSKLSKQASDRFGYLSLRYNTHIWSRVCSRSEYRESLYLLDVLDHYLPRMQIRNRCLDIGAKKWSYLPALAAYTQTPWDGVELDANQRYLSFSTRRAHAEYMIKGSQESRYITGSVLDLDGNYPLITWILPFISHDSFEGSELPERYYQPDALLKHAMSLLAPNGVMLIINQGVVESDMQEALFKQLDIKATSLGQIESLFSPYRQPRFGWLIEKKDN